MAKLKRAGTRTFLLGALLPLNQTQAGRSMPSVPITCGLSIANSQQGLRVSFSRISTNCIWLCTTSTNETLCKRVFSSWLSDNKLIFPKWLLLQELRGTAFAAWWPCVWFHKSKSLETVSWQGTVTMQLERKHENQQNWSYISFTWQECHVGLLIFQFGIYYSLEVVVTADLQNISGRVSASLSLSVCLSLPLQLATVTCTPDAVVSTWSSTSCRAAGVAASASTVVTTQRDAIATTVKRVTTETWPSPSRTGELAKVTEH